MTFLYRSPVARGKTKTTISGGYKANLDHRLIKYEYIK
jgi:hypothetical protein